MRISIRDLNPNRTTLAVSLIHEADLERKAANPVATLQRVMYRLDRSDPHRHHPDTAPAMMRLMAIARSLKGNR